MSIWAIVALILVLQSLLTSNDEHFLQSGCHTFDRGELNEILTEEVSDRYVVRIKM